MADQPKDKSKFNIQNIIKDFKSIISPPEIPEADKSNPVAYHLSEMNKYLKKLAESHAEQADVMAKLSAALGALHQEMGQTAAAAAPAPAPVATVAKEAKPEVAKEEKPKTEEAESKPTDKAPQA